jgi:hypothetical protein
LVSSSPAEIVDHDVAEKILAQMSELKSPKVFPLGGNQLNPVAAGGARQHLLVNKGQLVLFAARDGTAIIVFAAERVGSAEYRWRFKPCSDSPEESGSGRVFEAYKQEQTGPREVKVTDVGSQLFVRAGPIAVEWSTGGLSGNYLYVPSDMSARIVTGDFESIDLSQSR